MKKIFALTMAAALMAGLFAGCQRPQTESAIVQESTVSVEVGVAPETEATTQETVPETTAEPETAAEVPVGPNLVPEPTAKLLNASVERYYEIAQAKDNRQIYEITVPKAVAEGDFTALNESLARDFGIEYDYIQGRRQEFMDTFRAQGAEEFSNHCAKAEGVVCRADSSVFSMRTAELWDNGGSVELLMNGYNYRTSDGTLLTAADVFKDIDLLKSVLQKTLSAEYPDAGFFDLENDLKTYDASLLPTAKNAASPIFSFALTTDAAVFWFNKYELAPGASGNQTVILPYRDYAHLINEEFLLASRDYVTPLEPDVTNLISGREIKVTEAWNESGAAIDGVAVTVDGKESTIPAFCSSQSTYAVVKDGKVWLYVFRDCDDDEKYITVIDCNGEAAAIGEFEGGLSKEWEQKTAEAPLADTSTAASVTTIKQFTDPASFVLSAGKNGPAATYTVSETGMPEKK